MTSQIALFTIADKGITVSADNTGVVYLNGIKTTAPITAGGITFVWVPASFGAPPMTRLSLNGEALTKIAAHSATHRAMCIEAGRKARAHDTLYNEGGEGYNPYR